MGWFRNLWASTRSAGAAAVGAVTSAAKAFSVGIRAGLAGATPGGWSSDHREEAEHFTGWQYIAIHAGSMQAARAEVEVYDDEATKRPALQPTRRKSLRSTHGSISRYKATYGADDRETEPLPASHPLVSLLKHPNPWESGATFRYRCFQQLKLTGSIYIWNVPGRQTGANGKPVTVQRYILPTACVTPIWPTKDMPCGAFRLSPAVSRWFPARDAQGFEDFPGWFKLAGQVVDAREVQVIRLPHPIQLDDGQSPLSALAAWIDAGTQLDTSRYSQFLNGPNPSMVVTAGADQELSPEQALATAATINQKYCGAQNHGKVMVVNNGTTVTWPNGNTAKEMDYVQSFDQIRGAQLAGHHTPPVAVGLQDPGAYAAYNASLKSWRAGGVQPYLDMLAESDTSTLGPQYGAGVVIEIMAEHVDDAELLEKQLANDLAAKARTRNEWRAVRGMPPLPGPEGNELVGAAPAPAAGPGVMPPGGAGTNNGGGSGILDRLLGPVNRLNGHGDGADSGGSNSNGNGKELSSIGSALKSAARSRTYAVAAAGLMQAKSFDESKHPRDDNGRFISAGKIEAARTDKEAAVELLNQTTNPQERKKLVEALGPMGQTAMMDVAAEDSGAPDADVATVTTLKPDAISRKNKIEINTDGDTEHVQEFLEKLAGPGVKLDDAADWFGVPEQSKVDVYQTRLGGLEFSFSKPGEFEAKREIYRDDNGSLVCINHAFVVDESKQGNGLGARVFADQVKELASRRFDRIDTIAAGSSGDKTWVGYKVWPKLGYDGKIPDRVVRNLPPQFQDAKTVQQLYSKPGGREWWEANGEDVALSFDLNPKSASRKVLNAYLKRKAKPKKAMPKMAGNDNPCSPADEATLNALWEEITAAGGIEKWAASQPTVESEKE